jgi:hypothetical protein
VPGPDPIIYPDGQIIQGNVIILDQAGIVAFEDAGARNKLAEALQSGREDLPRRRSVLLGLIVAPRAEGRVRPGRTNEATGRTGRGQFPEAV